MKRKLIGPTEMKEMKNFLFFKFEFFNEKEFSNGSAKKTESFPLMMHNNKNFQHKHQRQANKNYISREDIT